VENKQNSTDRFYILDLRWPISFSSFMAACKLPEIFSFPVMKAAAGFSFPIEN